MTKTTPVESAARLMLWRTIFRVGQSQPTSSVAQWEAETEEAAEFEFVADDLVNGVVREWQQRATYLPEEMLSEPAWSIVLELLQAEIQGRRASLSRVRKVSAVPTSIADRWLNTLERAGFIKRRADPLHGTEDIVSLSRVGSAILRRYFIEVV